MTLREDNIREWLQRLGVVCPPTLRIRDVELVLAAYTSDLADMPTAMFCEASLRAVSREFEFFPSLAKLRKFLEKWWAKNKPTQSLALPAPEDPDLTTDDRRYLASWLNTRPAMVADGLLAMHIDVLKQHCPAAFRYVMRTDPEAARIASGRTQPEDARAAVRGSRDYLEETVCGGYFRKQREARARAEGPILDLTDITESGITRNLLKLEALASEPAVVAVNASLGLSLLRKHLQQHAPHLLHLLPDRIVRRVEAQPARTVEQQLDALGPGASGVAAAVAEVNRATAALPAETLERLRAADPAIAKARAQQEADRRKGTGSLAPELQPGAAIPSESAVSASTPASETRPPETDEPPDEPWDPRRRLRVVK